MLWIIIILLIAITLNLLYWYYNQFEYMTDVSNTSNTSKPIIWGYWENKPGKIRPSYLDLCLDTFDKYNKNSFNIIILNEKTVYDYLPNLRKDLNNFSLAHKSDYIRIKLLYTYGGIWLDIDTIVMRNLMPIIDKLNEGYDYVGFGCSYENCDNNQTGFPKPSNQAMASKKDSILMKRVLEKLDKFVDEHQNKKFEYFDMGKKLIWDAIEELQKEQNYKYYHYNSSYDGSRDINGKWVNVDNHISKTYTILLDNGKNLFFVFLENNKFMGNDPKYNWFSKLSKDEILAGPWWISYLFKISLQFIVYHGCNYSAFSCGT